jgi:hypothetical protein
MSPSAFEPWHAAGPGPQQTSEWAKLPSVVTWANTLVKGTNTVVIERTTDISVNGERTREEESERQGLAHLHPLSRNREEESVSQGRDDATTLDQAMSRGEEDNMLADLETAATTIQRRVRRFMPREKVKNHAEGSISDGSAKAEMISVDLRWPAMHCSSHSACMPIVPRHRITDVALLCDRSYIQLICRVRVRNADWSCRCIWMKQGMRDHNYERRSQTVYFPTLPLLRVCPGGVVCSRFEIHVNTFLAYFHRNSIDYCNSKLSTC